MASLAPLFAPALALLGVQSAIESSDPLDALAILSDRCFACHGPDGESRKAGLRLDTRVGVLGADEFDWAPVVPGDLEGSELIRRIRASADERMPPIDSGLTLSEREIEVLSSWVALGAEWSEHWSFVAPVQVEPPELRGRGWARGPLDRFVLARLEQRGMRPAPPAGPEQLLRRVTLDLSGLPPTPEEVAAYAADPSDAAYEEVVDRLLASPRYAERMAWDWLDAARYADTDGFQADPTREMWPWRDYLVDALDRNLPFDQLTLEFLAGDLLPDATPEQVLASGFHRNHAHNGEGGRIAEETRVENVFDRVETTGSVWLGLTVGCARCHDHKFDPLTQAEYFGLYDFFNQTSERGSGNNGRAPPVLRYLAREQRLRASALEAQIEGLERRALAPDAALDAEQADWESELREVLRGESAHSASTRLGAWHRTAVFAAPESSFAREHGPESGVDLDQLGAGGRPMWSAADGLADGTVFELPADLGSTYLVRDLDVPSERTLVLSLGSDDAIRVWLDGREVLANDVARGVAPDQERLELEVAPGGHQLLFKVVNTGGRAGFYFRLVEERVLGLTPALVGALEQRDAERSQADREGLMRAFRSRHAPWWNDAEAPRAELAALREGAPRVMVMDQLPSADRRETRLLERGAYDQPRDTVEAHTPSFLPELPAGGARDRLELARWLVAPEHPLTARVAVNRAWQTIFGRGLVASPEDFGRQGEAPSHPDLLDWLAREFVAGGWDTKALHRRLVLSATYRQSAKGTAAAFRDDPQNVWLARSSRHRLPSWMLRDQALALSGLLVETRGGPPVRPYQPDGVWAEATFDTIRYTRGEGDELYRRSLYVFWRRIVGPTVFFDSASRQTCELRPRRTNTPLHALITLNEEAYVEAARKLAERAWHAASSDRERAAWAFRTATARPAEVEELDLLAARFDTARAHFSAHREDAQALFAVGASARDESIDAADLAALAVVCSVVLNLDEVLTRP